MKKILRTLLCGILLVVPQVLMAQCQFANPAIRLIGPPVPASGGQCAVTLEISFDILHNEGGKYFWIHFWPGVSYPDYSYASSKPPVTSLIPDGNGALDASIATLGFYHKGSTLTIQTSYPPDNNAPNFQSGYSISEIEGGGTLPGSDRYTITGISFLLPSGCATAQAVKADLWESQAAHAQQVACFSKGTELYVNDPLLNGLLYCPVPREYAFTVRSIRTAGSLDLLYRVLIDNGDGIYNKGTDNLEVNTGTIILNSDNGYYFASGRLGYLPWSQQKPYADRSLWVVVSGPALPNEIYTLLYNSCMALPATLTGFRVQRNGTMAELNWYTETEYGNKGFFIEKRIPGGEWETSGFMASKGINGNSENSLFYRYAEMNISSHPTEYRLRQEDRDGQIRYSETRILSGWTPTGKLLLYPNPSADGQITAVLSNFNAPFIIELLDGQGRKIRQWVDYRNSQLIITGLQPGIYCLVLTESVNRTRTSGRFVISR